MAEPLHLSVAVGLGEDATASELDEAARRLRQEMQDAGLEDAALAPGEAAPAGAKSGEAFLIGALTLTVLPAMLTTLAGVARDWAGRRPGRTLKLAYSMGEQRFELEYDPDKVDVQVVMDRLLHHHASGGMGGPAGGAAVSAGVVGGDVVQGDKVSHVNADGDAVGRDKVTHIHAAAGATVIVHDGGVETRGPAAPPEASEPSGAAE